MRKNSLLLISTIFFVFTICYFLLVAGNVLLKRIYNNTYTQSFSDALDIEAEREISEDLIAISNAKRDGYESVLTPFFFDFPRQTKAMQDLVSIYKFIPLGAQPNKNVYYCNEGYGLIKYKSDRFGFRNPDSLWDEPQSTQVLLIGDSLVHGACVNEESTFRANIAKSFPRTINLGMAGSGPNNYLRTAEYFIEKNTPEIVIIFIFANDNEGKYKTIFKKDYINNPYYLLNEGNEEGLKAFYEETSRVVSINKDSMIKKNNLWIRLSDDLKLEFIRKLLFNSFEATTDLIDGVVGLCNTHSCDPYFVYLPTSQYWRPDSRQDRFRNDIKNYLSNEYNLEKNYLDVTSFVNDDKTFYAPKGPHYSDKGYKLISAKVVEMIKHKNN